MDQRIRFQCRGLLQMWLAQLRSGQPIPEYLNKREFEAMLEHVCAELEEEDERSAFKPGESLVAMELIVAADIESARDGFSHLRRWLSDATEVTICDPYLFQFRPSPMFPDLEAYVSALTRIVPQSVQRLDLYTNGYAAAVRTPLLRALKEGRSVRHFSSDALHDRFVIKDQCEAKVIGTSFGGFGNKFFALIDLSSSDTADVRTHLRNLCPFPVQLNRG